MGFLKNIFSKKKNSYEKYDKIGETLKNKVTTKEQRLEAIEILGKLPCEEAVPRLLKRFELSVDSGIQDTREKELCLEIIVNFGENAKEFVLNAIQNNRHVAWPLKIAEKLFSSSEYVDILLRNLDPDMQVFDDASLEKNEELLLTLKEVTLKREDIVEKASLFLNSRNENIRMAAIQCLEHQATESARARSLILAMTHQDVTDDNSRFLGFVKNIVAQHNWH